MTPRGGAVGGDAEATGVRPINPPSLTSRNAIAALRRNTAVDVADGSNASVELSRHVGFTPNSGRMAATQRTDASGQIRTHAPQQICELGVNTPSLLDKTQAVSCRCHQPECPLSSGYPDFLGSFLDLSNPGIDLVLSDRTHRMINDDGLKVRHAKSLSG